MLSSLVGSWKQWSSRRKQKSSAPAGRRRLGVEQLENRVTPITWTNAAGDMVWENPLNWDAHHVPLPDEDVYVSVSPAIAGSDVTIHSLNAIAPLTFGGDLTLTATDHPSYMSASISIAGELTMGDDFSLNLGGSFGGAVHVASGALLALYQSTYSASEGVYFDGQGTVQVKLSSTLALNGHTTSFTNLDLEGGTISGAPTATLSGTMTFAKGTLTGGGTLNVTGGTLNFTGYDPKTLDWNASSDTVTTWTAGTITSHGYTFTNTGTFTMNGMAGATWDNPTGLFQNDGEFDSSNARTMAVYFNSTDLVNVLSSTLTLTQGGQFLGQAAASGAATLILAGGVFQLLDGLQGAGDGTVAQQGADSVVTGMVTMRNYDLIAGTLRGTGTLVITNRMKWTGGAMADDGSLNINSGAQLNATPQSLGSFVVSGRHIRILGTGAMNINPAKPASAITLDSDASLYNEGTISISTTSSQTFLLFTDDTYSFENFGSVNVSGGGWSVVAGGTFSNYGSFTASAGKLDFSAPDSWINYGFIEAASGTQVGFRTGGTFVFDPETNDTDSYMMRGAGSFTVADGAEVSVVPGYVLASNFYLNSGGVLRGLGTFEAQYFTWNDGGEMEDAGVTWVSAPDFMFIQASDAVMADRELRISGVCEWSSPSAQANTISLNGSALLNISGGRFDVFLSNGAITRDGQGSINVENGGVFDRDYVEVSGTVDIAAPTTNAGGRVVANAPTTFSAVYRQTAAAARLELGGGSYDLSSSVLTAGTVTLAGGEANFGNQLITNVTLELSGSIRGGLQLVDSELNLTGDLSTSSRIDLTDSAAHIRGFLLSVGGNMTANQASTLYFENGSINTSLPAFIDGAMIGPGFLNGNPVP